MRISTIRGILEMPRGTKLEAVRGTITKVYPPKKGTNDHGDWSFQNCEFKDSTGVMPIVLKDREEIGKDWVGATVLIEAGQHKNNPTGIEVEDHEHNGKTTRRIKVTASATFADGSEVVDTQPDAPPTGNRPAPPPGQQRRQPPVDLQEEERREQQNARPAPRPQQQQAPTQQRHNGPPAGSEQTTEQKILTAKRDLLELTTLYTMSHDAAVLHAASVYMRHGHTMPPEAIGALATTLFIEANKRCIRPPAVLSTQMQAPKFKLSDFLMDRPAAEPEQPATTEALAEMPEHKW